MGRLIAWATTLVALILVQARPALADSDGSLAGDQASSTNARAEQSFHEGHTLLKDKRYREACAKFEESQRQDPASGTLLALAYCQELAGQLASAWESYQAAARLAEREGHADRQSAANERVQALGSRVSRLTVIVPAELLSLPGFHLVRDGAEFERASFGVAVPTDGGPHGFQATAPGRVPWTSMVTLLPEHDQKTLVLPVLDLVPPPQPAGDGVTAREKENRSAPEAGGTHESEVALKRASLAFAVATAVGVGVGTAFTLSAQSKNDQSNANGHCDSRGCDEQGSDLRNSALSAARVATWSFVASGALAVCSVTLFVSANSNHSAAKGVARLQGGVSHGAPSVSLVGNF